MTPEQSALLLKEMESIDRGNSIPRLPGPYGAFLRHYAGERNDVSTLATHMQVPVRKDGSISGVLVGPVTFIRLGEVPTITKTTYGELASVAGLCPELGEFTVLRLWLDSASGREAFRFVMQGVNSISLAGEFRWMPFSYLTPGTASMDAKNTGESTSSSWCAESYIAVSGNDLIETAHALEYRNAFISGQWVVARVGSMVVIVTGDGRFLVPNGARAKPVSIDLRGLDRSSSPSDMYQVLAYQEAGEEIWHAWKSVPIGPQDAVDHELRRVAFRRMLKGEMVDDADWDRCTSSLFAAGIRSVGAGSFEATTKLELADPTVTSFARAAHSLIRFGGNTEATRSDE